MIFSHIQRVGLQDILISTHIDNISLVLLVFTKHASTGGLVLQIRRWPSSSCTVHHGICGPCLQLDFLHAQTSRQAYGRLANMCPDIAECGVGRNKNAMIQNSYKLVCLIHEELDCLYQVQSD